MKYGKGLGVRGKGVFGRLTPHALLFTLIFSGCVLPIRSEDLPGIIKNISESSASACLKTGAQGGGGAAAIAPVPVPGGGWGSADLVVCRSNQPGSEIAISPDGTMSIKHGSASTAELAKVKEQLDLLEAVIAYLARKEAERQEVLKKSGIAHTIR